MKTLLLSLLCLLLCNKLLAQHLMPPQQFHDYIDDICACQTPKDNTFVNPVNACFLQVIQEHTEHFQLALNTYRDSSSFLGYEAEARFRKAFSEMMLDSLVYNCPPLYKAFDSLKFIAFKKTGSKAALERQLKKVDKEMHKHPTAALKLERASLAYSLGDHEAALLDLHFLIEANRSHMQAYFLRAVIREQSESYQEALLDYYTLQSIASLYAYDAITFPVKLYITALKRKMKEVGVAY